MKVYLLNLLAKLLFGKWATPIKRIIETIIISNSDLIDHCRKIRSAEIIEFHYPERFDSFFIRNLVFPEQYLYKLNEVIIIRENGVIMTTNEMILQESIGSIRRLFRWDDIRNFLKKKPQELILDKPCYYLPNKPFYHFLLEEVPALLFALENYKNVIVITGSLTNYPKYYYNTLNLVLGTDYLDKIKVIKNNVKVKNYILIQCHNNPRRIHKKEIKLLNQYFLAKSKCEKIFKRVYISRTKSINRKIDNEEEIEIFLRMKGFKILYLEDFSLEEQIGIIQNCEIIVSPHGAGLSHLVWNPALKKKIIEIFPSYITNDCYANIAFLLGYRYDYIKCKQDKNLEICDLIQLEQKLLELMK